jgi:glycerol-3-phosphate acyltransferase PlsY
MSPILVYVALAFLIGSIPTGFIAAALMGKGSVLLPGGRTTKNAGDILQMLGLKMWLFVTFLDFLKGLLTVSVLHSSLIGAFDPFNWKIIGAGAMAVVIGHCNSPWLGFRGGKGLATITGIQVYMLPAPTIVSGCVGFCLSFWGLSTRPGALASAAIMPIASIPWVLWLRPEKSNYLLVVAFLSLWTMWEYRVALKGYMGIKDHEPAPPFESPTDLSAPTEPPAEAPAEPPKS